MIWLYTVNIIIYRHFGNKGSYLPLYKLADTTFCQQVDYMYVCISFLCWLVFHLWNYDTCHKHDKYDLTRSTRPIHEYYTSIGTSISGVGLGSSSGQWSGILCFVEERKSQILSHAFLILYYVTICRIILVNIFFINSINKLLWQQTFFPYLF